MNCEERKPFSDRKIVFSLHDLECAEYRSRGILGHEDVVARLEELTARPAHEQKVARDELSDTERDIIEGYCQIKGEEILIP